MTPVSEGLAAGEVGEQCKDVTEDSDGFAVSFQIMNTCNPNDAVDYCLVVTAKDNALYVDGSPNPNTCVQVAHTRVTWNPLDA